MGEGDKSSMCFQIKRQ